MPRSDILLHRLHNQGILGKGFSAPNEMVGQLGAVQGQDYLITKWAFGLRIPGSKQEDVDNAMENGTILRTHIMRPTWHFVTPKDIRWIQMLTAPRVRQAMAYYNRQQKLGPQVYTKSNALIEKELKGGNALTRKELGSILKKAGIPSTNLQVSFLLMGAELDALVCSGPLKGKQFTYMLVDDRAPKAKTLTKEESLVELASRYFTSHGPATLSDFTWWSGLTVAEAKQGIEKSKLRKEEYGEQTYWFGKNTPVNPVPLTAHLLPTYDEYVIGYKSSRSLFSPTRPFDMMAQIPFFNCLMIDGHVAGMWRRVLKSKHIELHIRLSVSLESDEKEAVEKAIEAYSTFHGLPVQTSYGKSTT